MEITQIGNIINLSSIPLSNHVCLHIIQKVTTSDEFIEHVNFSINTSNYILQLDGYYKIIEIKLPNSANNLNIYSVNGVIYNSFGEILTTENLLEQEDLLRSDYNIFSFTCLENYYQNLIKGRFLKNNLDCKTLQNKITIDTLTMGLEVLKKLVYFSQYYEAQRILEQLNVCSEDVISNCNCNG